MTTLLNIIALVIICLAAYALGIDKGRRMFTSQNQDNDEPNQKPEFAKPTRKELQALEETLKTIFWRNQIQIKNNSFLIFHEKTQQLMATVRISKTARRKYKSMIDGTISMTYTGVPSESEIRSDLSKLFW